MNQDKRHMRRFPPIPDRDTAVLLLKSKKRQVRLLDESATGISIATGKKLRAKPGQKAALQIGDSWYEVEVKRVDVLNGETRIALNRVDVSERERSSWTANGSFDPYKHQESSNLLLVLSLIAIGLLVLYVTGVHRSGAAGDWFSLLGLWS